MSAWFRQNNLAEQTDIQTILIFAQPKIIVWDSFSKNNDDEPRKMQINYEGCQISWADFNIPWIPF